MFARMQIIRWWHIFLWMTIRLPAAFRDIYFGFAYPVRLTGLACNRPP
jgi:hypothetical protein